MRVAPDKPALVVRPEASISDAASRIFRWNSATCRRLLGDAGHQARMFDCHLLAMSIEELRREVSGFPAGDDRCHDRADVPVLRARLLNCACRGSFPARGETGIKVAGGAPRFDNARAALRKLDADVIVIGECEETLVRLGERGTPQLPGIAYRDGRRSR